ncbi:glycerol dehydrogenase [Lagierella sp.]|uniref:glycerol dehydrogenase n=1 Tax=Lagierella sp. TaxID=2849657 RepID=UPI0026293A26|nr:glycerol dehydrogenase [Lagierella sp.]
MLKLIRTPQKYIQGRNAFEEFYDYGKDYGERFLFVASGSGLKYCKDKLEKSFGDSGVYRRYEEFAGISSNGEIDRMSEIIKEDNIDVVVGLGGGSAIDTAKASAYYTKKPIIVLPTVVATDAPCTGLSVIYNDDGTFDRYIFYPDNPNMVMVDTNVIANAPSKFLVAGIGDALATYYEARACKKVGAPSLENGGISDSALALCKLCNEILFEHGEIAIASLEKRVVNESVDKIIEAATYLSGVGADNGGLAAAHSIYNGFTEIEFVDAMHGEIVAFGTIVQLLMEASPKEELYKVIDLCYKLGLPLTLEDLNIKEEDLMIGCEKACAEGETIHNLVGEVTPERLKDFVLTADSLGTKYYEEHKK